MHRFSRVAATLAVLFSVVLLASCGSSDNNAQNRASQGNKDLQGQVYVQHNNVEFNNYNDRQKIADDPTTILWCTYYPTNPNARPITVPVAGKLTSSHKRPYATSIGADVGTPTEQAGPDKMFGDSGNYRYGFTPAHVYWEFSDSLEGACSTQPSIYQSQKTELVLGTDPTLSAASKQASSLLAKGDKAGAQQALLDGINKVGGK